MYRYNRVTSICIDLSKIKLFVFVFVRTDMSILYVRLRYYVHVAK